MVPTARSSTRRAVITSASFALLLAAGSTGSHSLLPACSAHRFSHHKASPRPAHNANTTSSRNASYASGSTGRTSDAVDNPFKMDRPLNVFGRPLAQCGTNPITGFYRDGYCNTGAADGGSHTVAAVVSQKWLDFSAAKGNDLRPILSEGCSWCLCVSRWKQSLDAYKRGELAKDAVPKVKLEATHQRALDLVSIDDLKTFALEEQSARPTSASQDPARGGPIR